MTKLIAPELVGKSVTANCVAPGFTTTEMLAVLPYDYQEKIRDNLIPLKRFGSPTDIANAVAILASEKAGYITGQVLAGDGGMSMELCHN